MAHTANTPWRREVGLILDKLSAATILVLVLSVLGFFAVTYGIIAAIFLVILGLVILPAALPPKPRKDKAAEKQG